MVTKVIAYTFGVFTIIIIGSFLFGFFRAVFRDLKNNGHV